jgi:hypothetical protein
MSLIISNLAVYRTVSNYDYQRTNQLQISHKKSIAQNAKRQ